MSELRTVTIQILDKVGDVLAGLGSLPGFVGDAMQSGGALLKIAAKAMRARDIDVDDIIRAINELKRPVFPWDNDAGETARETPSAKKARSGG